MIPPIGANADINQNANVTNQAIRELNSREVSQQYKDDNGNKSLVIGKKPNGKRGIIMYAEDGETPLVDFGVLPDGTNGMKVAESGVDVLTALDSELVFNSAQNVFKIVQQGEVTHTTPDPWASGGAIVTRTQTIPHNLGYTPACLVYSDNPSIGATYGASGITPLPTTFYVMGGTALPLIYIYPRVDDTNLYIDLLNMGSSISPSYTWTFRYYLLQETAN